MILIWHVSYFLCHKDGCSNYHFSFCWLFYYIIYHYVIFLGQKRHKLILNARIWNLRLKITFNILLSHKLNSKKKCFSKVMKLEAVLTWQNTSRERKNGLHNFVKLNHQILPGMQNSVKTWGKTFNVWDFAFITCAFWAICYDGPHISLGA